MNIRPATTADGPRISELLIASWGSHIAVAHGVAYDATTLPAIVAEEGDRIVGLLTYNLQGQELEVVTIDAPAQHRGVGSALLEAAAEAARGAGARRLWLITTNDNLDALRFYQRRGMRIVEVRPGAVDESRKLKPTIPPTGAYDIPSMTNWFWSFDSTSRGASASPGLGVCRGGCRG
ncbi:acetyltransferase (GNAT) family protein [Kribbella rubisoli]|uniref:Acetyltransferase (GNAT) family protein n=1 Tax=Kribbella rubisoli TaxID=3075929 RepID=A0A4Q7WTA1_9ACTN|nr:GNAT family N-acetyltransferase [Kribbella rubisoli]RZU13624.1 acetyltransferase (GNAT) family protein [Kribbella rubisoli]